MVEVDVDVPEDQARPCSASRLSYHFTYNSLQESSFVAVEETPLTLSLPDPELALILK